MTSLHPLSHGVRDFADRLPAGAETLAEHSPTPMRFHGIMDVYGESGPDAALLEKYRLSAGQVAAVVSEHLEARP